jgi:hypothetical protein
VGRGGGGRGDLSGRGAEGLGEAGPGDGVVGQEADVEHLGVLGVQQTLQEAARPLVQQIRELCDAHHPK